jgi:hypothetical protein
VGIVRVLRVEVDRDCIADSKNALVAIYSSNVPRSEGLPRNHIAELVSVVIPWFVRGQYPSGYLFSRSRKTMLDVLRCAKTKRNATPTTKTKAKPLDRWGFLNIAG